MRRELARLRYARYVGGFSQLEQESVVKAAIDAAGLDWRRGQETLDPILHDIRGNPFDFGNDSVHWLVFACLSMTTMPADRILEIGTYDGSFTAILARLFPQAEIITVDLPDSDPILRATYKRDREAEFRRFLDRRNHNLAAVTIRFVETNSVFLLEDIARPVDLVWVDGGHHYPEVAWDLAAAHYLCREGGSVLCDDVMEPAEGRRTAYVSSDSYEAFHYIAGRTGAKPNLFLKRCKFMHAGVPGKRKYVAMMARLAIERPD